MPLSAAQRPGTSAGLLALGEHGGYVHPARFPVLRKAHPVLPDAAAHVQYPFPEVYVAPLKSHGLSEPQAGAGQREQEGIAVGVVPLCHIEQCGQLPTSGHFDFRSGLSVGSSTACPRITLTVPRVARIVRRVIPLPLTRREP